MVNTELYEAAVARSGKRKDYLAKQAGCSVQSLRLKVTNKYDFTVSEVEALCRELNITKLTDKENIFFARNVDKTSTSNQ